MFFLGTFEQLRYEMESQNKINMQFLIWIPIVRVNRDLKTGITVWFHFLESHVILYFISFHYFTSAAKPLKKKMVKQLKTFYASIFRLREKKPTSISFSLRSRRYCVMQFCLCCTNKGSQVLCTWQWISLSHWMDAMMT